MDYRKGFRIIDLIVPPHQAVDTVDLYFPKERQRRVSLRFLSWFLLKEAIQIETHDSPMPYTETTSREKQEKSCSTTPIRSRFSCMTRLVMTKKYRTRWLKDEADIAFGREGIGRGRIGGFDEEFSDVLRVIGRGKQHKLGGGYEEPGAATKKPGAPERSKVRKRGYADDKGTKDRCKTEREDEVQ